MTFDQLSVLAIHLIETKNHEGFSKIGGFPDLPEGMEWPTWRGEPLSFICQLSLAEFNAPPTLQGLAKTGYLYFFYDQEQTTWGFDPGDVGSWRVLYSEADPVPSSEEAPAGLDEEHIFAEKKVQFSRFSSLPDPQRVELPEGGDDDFFDRLSEEKHSSYGDHPHHQIGGFPDVIQSDEMELECQLVSNGLYCGDGTGYQDPRAKELEAGASSWRLLLQIDSDEEVGMMWGDSGLIYFWIREEDLREKKFENVWMVLQCS